MLNIDLIFSFFLKVHKRDDVEHPSANKPQVALSSAFNPTLKNIASTLEALAGFVKRLHGTNRGRGQL